MKTCSPIYNDNFLSTTKADFKCDGCILTINADSKELYHWSKYISLVVIILAVSVLPLALIKVIGSKQNFCVVFILNFKLLRLSE